MKALSTIFLILVCLAVNGQSISINPTITPEFFVADEPITIEYDVTGTELSTLSEAWLWLWLPDQTNVNVASNINPASSNTTATNPAKFARQTNGGQVIFTITLTLTDFTDAPAQDIKQVGMLIKGNDWSDGQSTDYITSVSDGFSLKLESPANHYAFYQTGAIIDVLAKSSEPSSISLFVDGMLQINQSDITELSTQHPVIEDGEVHELRIEATNGSETIIKNHTYTVNPVSDQMTIPAGLTDGINYTSSTSATLVLLAPNHDNVFVLGDFNDWSLSKDYMMKQDGERFWLEIDGLVAGEEYIYQYLVNGDISIADPYAERVSSAFDDPEIIEKNKYPNLRAYPSGASGEEASYLLPGQASYPWTVTNFIKPDKEKLVIYELLVRDFTDERSFNAVTERLDYLSQLGVNAIEFLPIMEFEGNLSWGYNPSFMTAVDKFYGTEDDLKFLIDQAHARGMAVILDIALNHAFGRSPLVRLDNDDVYGPPTTDNVWFNRTAKHDFNVGYDFNHESEYTNAYAKRVIKYWLEEYRVDGYRFDLSKGFTQKNTIGNVDAWGQYDANRVALWKDFADFIWTIDPEAYVILEHFATNSEEKELAEYGMMLWGNMNHVYRNAAKGNSAVFSNLYHAHRGWSEPNLIGYMESHDEERVAWDAFKSLSYYDGLQRLKLNAAFFLTVPGPKMLWQFQEFGYDEELNNDRLGVKPTRWEYLDEEPRAQLFDIYASLIRLKTETPYISPSHFSWSTSGDIKYIQINHPDVHIVVVGNFDDGAMITNAHLTQDGTWYNYFSEEEIEVSDYQNFETRLSGGEFKIFTSEPIDNYLNYNPNTLITSVSTYQEVPAIYPNPATTTVHIDVAQDITRYTLYDANGRVVMSGASEGSIEVSALQRGIYLLELKNADRTYRTKLIKN